MKYFEVTSDRKKWREILYKISPFNKDIYFTYEYCKMYEENGDGISKVALYEGYNGMIIVYPFLLCEIKGYDLEGKYYDIESCYGYGGPCVENYNEQDMKEFEETFISWAIENNIVAEFIRFHPMIENHNYFKNNIKVEQNRLTVFIDLEPDLNEIWMNSINSKNRNMIKKAQKAELIPQVTKDYKDFLQIYSRTMERLRADRLYYFSKDYFKQLFESENYFIIDIKKCEETIASGVFIYNNYYLNYHLAGSIYEYLNLAPNNLLLYSAIQHGKNLGLSKFYLGGGRTAQENDSLLLFKKSFSNNVKTFYIGKRIINKKIYDILISKWEKNNNQKAKLFLQYNIV